jgi:lysozyme
MRVFFSSFYVAWCSLTLLMPYTTSASGGPRAEDSWQPLTEEASRADLFEKVISGYLASPERTEDASKSLAIPSGFQFPADADFDRIENRPRDNSIFCIDINHYTGLDIDLQSLRLQSVKCVYVKASQGITFKDNHFQEFWSKLESLSSPSLNENDRLYRGAYLFLSAGISGSDQADAFVDYVNLHGGISENDLPPVIDVEWDVSKGHPEDRWIGHTSEDIIQNILSCAKRLKERTGRTPIIYTAKSWWTQKTVPLSQFFTVAEYPLWIADYNPKRKLVEKPAVPPGGNALVWQYTDRAQLSVGYQKGLDASIFYGSVTDFKNKFGLPK